ncbi:MAG: hypothetical protein ABWZ16_06470, partial [Microbacterium sp.]
VAAGGVDVVLAEDLAVSRWMTVAVVSSVMARMRLPVWRRPMPRWCMWPARRMLDLAATDW